VVSVYDDYPVMVLAQLQDLGLVADGGVADFIRGRLAAGGYRSIRPAGSCAQDRLAPAEVCTAWSRWCDSYAASATETGRPGTARLVTGYGMVLYRHGASASAAVLEVES